MKITKAHLTAATFSLLIIFYIMHLSVAAAYTLRPILIGLLASGLAFSCIYLMVHGLWHRMNLIVLFGFISIKLFVLTSHYTKELKEFYAQEEVILYDVVLRTCQMAWGPKAVEIYGSDENSQKHSVYTNKTTSNSLRGHHFRIKYLPTSKKVVDIKPHIKPED